MTDDEARAIRERVEKATPGPWAVEECGAKGDGSYMVGVVFALEGDPNCERPLLGWLEPYDDLGNEIEYYRDELIADCDFSNNNSGADAIFIAHARTDITRLLSSREADRKEIERLQAEIKDRISLSNLWENLWHDAEKEIGELKEQLSTAVSAERARCAGIVAAEPELPGPMPDDAIKALAADPAEFCRAIVRSTKNNIARAIEASDE